MISDKIETDEKDGLSFYEKEIQLTEKWHSLFVFNLYMLNQILTESQNQYNKIKDPELKSEYGNNIEQVKKYIKEWEEKKEGIIKTHEQNKRYLELLK